MNRRHLLSGILSGAAALTATFFGASAEAQIRRQRVQQPRSRRGGRYLTRHDNAYFYNEDGTFNQEAAKKAFSELFQFHQYSLPDVVNDERFWVVDFGLGDFANVGMGGIFWVNDKEQGYFGHEIYLLPNQMIPEHRHVAAEDKPAKHEYWQVRNGSIYNFGQGGSKDDKLPIKLPQSQLDADAITCFKYEELKATTGKGGEAVLTNLEDWHFMIAGLTGAIVTEYASYHAGGGLQFQNKNAKS